MRTVAERRRPCTRQAQESHRCQHAVPENDHMGRTVEASGIHLISKDGLDERDWLQEGSHCQEPECRAVLGGIWS